MTEEADPVLAERAALVLCALDCIKRLRQLQQLDVDCRVDDLRQISQAAEDAAWFLVDRDANWP